MSEATAQTETTSAAERQKRSLVGINGWLILPLLALFGTIALTAFNMLPLLQNLETLTAMSGKVGLIVLISVTLAVALIAYSIVCIVQFLKTKRRVPRLMVIYFVFLILVTLFESGVVISVEEFRSSPSDISSAWGDLARIAIASAIWIPYFLVSKRVRATFVN